MSKASARLAFVRPALAGAGAAALLGAACAATDGKALPPDHGPLDCPEGFVRNTSIPAPWCSRIHSLQVGNPCSDTTGCAEGLYCDMDRGWTCQTTVTAR